MTDFTKWMVILYGATVAVTAWGVGRALHYRPNGERNREPTMYAIAWMGLVFAVMYASFLFPVTGDPAKAILRVGIITATFPLLWIVFAKLMRSWLSEWRWW